MKFMKLNVAPLELTLFIIFVLYLVLPLDTPKFISSGVNHSIGMVLVVVITLYLFLYVHPILGILSIFVAYELMRRSSKTKVKHVRFETPTQSKKDADMKKMNPPKEYTLEEDVIAKMAPMRKHGEFIVTSYKPVSEDIHSALLLK